MGTSYETVQAAYRLVVTVVSSLDGHDRTDEWIVCQALGSGPARDLSYTPTALPLRLKPAVGVACHVSTNGVVHPNDQSGLLLDRFRSAIGVTDLPVVIFGHFQSHCGHVVGFDNNRVVPMSSCTAVQQQWNRLLLESVTACYTEVIDRLARHPAILAKPREIYGFWMRPNPREPALTDLCTATTKQLSKMKVFFLTNGRRVPMSDGHFLSGAVEGPLRNYMSDRFDNCMELPLDLVEQLRAAQIGRSIFSRTRFSEVTPKLFRAHVRSEITSKESLQQTYAEAAARASLATEMLVFCHSDVADRGEAAQREALRGLRLLPLESGELKRVGATKAVMATEREKRLLGSSALRFMHPSVSERLAREPRLQKCLAGMGVRTFDLQFLGEHLGRTLPPEWRRRSTVPWDGRGVPDPEWLLDLWQYAAEELRRQRASSGLAEAANDPAADPAPDVLEPLASWPLLPIDDGRLLSVASRAAALCLPEKGCPVGSEVLEGMRKLGMPVVAAGFASACHGMAGSCAPEPGEDELWPTYLATKLAQVHTAGLTRPVDDPLLAGHVYQYFRSREPLLEKTDIVKTGVAAAPIFRLHSGEIGRLPAQGAWTYDPAAFSGVGLGVPTDKAHLAFDDSAGELYKFLGVAVIPAAEVLLTHILPKLPGMDIEASHRILTYIKDDWAALKVASPTLPAVLAGMPCVASGSGALVQPSTLVDTSGSELLRAVYAYAPHRQVCPDRFPASDPSWSAFLRNIGVRFDVDEDLFLDCCDTLQARAAAEAENGQAGEEVLAVAAALTSHFVQFASRLGSQRPGFHGELAARAVVPSRCPRTGVYKLWRFQDCCLAKDLPLCFQAKPCLADDHQPPPVLWGRLGIRTPPVMADVLTHVARLTDDVLDNWSQPSNVEDCFATLFQHLADNVGSLDPDAVQRLRQSRFVPVNGRFASPSQLFFMLPDELGPYLFSVPRLFSDADGLFRRLGVQEQPTADTFRAVLQRIAASADESMLGPSELHGTVRLLRVLAKICGPSGCRGLWVPNTHSRMAQVSQCVVDDLGGFEVDVGRIGITLVHPLAKGLCDQLGLRRLSTMVKGRLKKRPVLAEPPIEVPKISPHIAEILLSHLRQTEEMVPLEVQLFVHSLPRVEIVTVSELAVEHYWLPSKQDVSRLDASPMWFFDKDNLKLYLKTPFPPGGTAQDAVAAAVLRHIPCSTPLQLAALLRAPDSFLAGLAEQAAMLGMSFAHKGRGVPGQPVCAEDALLLKLCPTRHYYVGKVVALQRPSGHVYAQVSRDNGAGAATLASQGAGVLPMLSKVLLWTKPGCEEAVMPSEVWSFALSSSSSLAPHGNNVGAMTDGRAAARKAPEEGSGWALVRPGTTVTGADFKGALEKLLAQAGVTVSLEASELASTNFELRQLLAVASAQRADGEKLLVEAERKLDTFRTESTCPVCLMGRDDGVHVDTALVPCGHTFCTACASSLSECAACKSRIGQRLRLFR